MKRIGAVLIIGLALTACQSDENSLTSEFTGNEVTYALYQASLYPVSGSVTFKEKRD